MMLGDQGGEPFYAIQVAANEKKPAAAAEMMADCTTLFRDLPKERTFP